MDTKKTKTSAYEVSLFRFGIISELLSRPPAEGELASRLREISERTYTQSWDQTNVNVSVRTLERWYSKARKAEKPTENLQPKLRKDRGKYRVLAEEHILWLSEYRKQYPSWSVQLLFDNMRADSAIKTNIPSYSTILRYLKSEGFITYKMKGKKYNGRDIRSYEVEFVGQLWHMDFHKGSRTIITENGEIKQPICMAIIDDKSRLVCHAQWFFNETTEVLVHGMIQAIMKRGIPRTFYSDNGSAMLGGEFKQGLISLDIKQEKTLPYSPYQNGKQESFWQPLEGRFIKMLPAGKRITLSDLNRLTQAWVEQDYHVTIHSEIKETPLNRFLNEKDVLRRGAGYNELKKNFGIYVNRAVRKTDGTVTIDGVRFQLPEQYAHFDNIMLRYARWDLGVAEIICSETRKSLHTITPLDKLKNSLGVRKQTEIKKEVEKVNEEESYLDLSNENELPPLMQKCLREHSQKFPLKGYIPYQTSSEGENK